MRSYAFLLSLDRNSKSKVIPSAPSLVIPIPPPVSGTSPPALD